MFGMTYKQSFVPVWAMALLVAGVVLAVLHTLATTDMDSSYGQGQLIGRITAIFLLGLGVPKVVSVMLSKFRHTAGAARPVATGLVCVFAGWFALNHGVRYDRTKMVDVERYVVADPGFDAFLNAFMSDPSPFTDDKRHHLRDRLEYIESVLSGNYLVATRARNDLMEPYWLLNAESFSLELSVPYARLAEVLIDGTPAFDAEALALVEAHEPTLTQLVELSEQKAQALAEDHERLLASLGASGLASSKAERVANDLIASSRPGVRERFIAAESELNQLYLSLALTYTEPSTGLSPAERIEQRRQIVEDLVLADAAYVEAHASAAIGEN